MKQPERESWYAVHDQSGKVYGPFDPGAVWFETPATVRGSDRLQLARASDLILNEAHGGWERLQRALCFLQPGGVALWRRFQEQGVVPEQTPALAGMAGGVDVPAFLGDGMAGGAGLHFNDAHNGTTIPGAAGGTGFDSDGITVEGYGPGRGAGVAVAGSGRAGGGGFGTDGEHGDRGGENRGRGGEAHHADIFRALREDEWSQDTLNFGGGGGSTTATLSRGGQSGDGYVEVVNGTLATVARSYVGRDGVNRGGGGAGGGLFLLGYSIAYGSGAITLSGGAGDDGGGAGGDGRVYQFYFNAFASNLMVTGGVQDQFRLLRSPTGGLPAFL